MKKHNIKFRIIVSAFALIITAFCTVLSAVIPLETTPVKTAGSFASIFIITAAAWKFPDRFYLLAMIFDIFAAALGSVINLYRYIGFYDRFVHYLSGILLAEAGMLIILYLFKKKSSVRHCRKAAPASPTILPVPDPVLSVFYQKSIQPNSAFGNVIQQNVRRCFSGIVADNARKE